MKDNLVSRHLVKLKGEKPNVVELKRLGNFDEKKVKPRSLLTTLSREQ